MTLSSSTPTASITVPTGARRHRAAVVLAAWLLAAAGGTAPGHAATGAGARPDVPPAPAVAAPAAPPAGAPAQGCAADARFHLFDFWLGEWDVLDGERRVGGNRIEAILGGCAFMEFWTDADGNEGRSLFYYLPVLDRWKQVWITTNPTRSGGIKEKELVAQLEDGGVRFQGTLMGESGRSYFDRTTLTPLPGGRVRQWIEVSRDGVTWRTTFDAVYVRRGAATGGG